jgi:hypothetical protein
MVVNPSQQRIGHWAGASISDHILKDRLCGPEMPILIGERLLRKDNMIGGHPGPCSRMPWHPRKRLGERCSGVLKSLAVVMGA